MLVGASCYRPEAAGHGPYAVTAEAAWSVVGLALICTALAFIVFFALIAEVGPARATVFTYVNPAVALLLGVVLLGERFTVGIAIGFPLILVGSVLAARRVTVRPPAVHPPSAAVPEGAVAVPVPDPVAEADT